MQEDESKLPNRKTTLKVKHLMKSISEVAVRKIDNSLTPFYLWVCVMYSNIDNDTSILLVFKCLWFMVFNGTFNNISVISWRSVLLVVVADKLYHIVFYRAHLAWAEFELTTLMVISTDCIGSCKYNFACTYIGSEYLVMLDYLFSTLAGTEYLFSKNCRSPPPTTSSELNGNPPPECFPLATSCLCYHL